MSENSKKEGQGDFISSDKAKRPEQGICAKVGCDPSVRSGVLRVAVIASHSDAGLTKSLHLNDDGTVGKVLAGMPSAGSVEVIQLNSMADFQDVLNSIESDQCITYGYPEPGEDGDAYILKAKASGAVGKGRVIARTNEFFSFREGPGIVCIDYDPRGSWQDAKGLEHRDPPLAPDELINAIMNAAGGALDDVPILWRPSAGSCVVNEDSGEELIGTSGQRLYIPVADGREIPAILEQLHDLVTINGHGWFEVTANGNTREDSIIDLVMRRPTQPDFACPAVCMPPLTHPKDSHVGKLVHADGDRLLRLADLPPVDNIKLAKAQRANREQVEAWAAARRAEWLAAHPVERRVHEMRQSGATGIPADVHVLVGDDTVELRPNVRSKERYEVAVTELLDNCAKYQDWVGPDPIEPGYRGDDRIAIAQLQPRFDMAPGAYQPRIYSHAHGRSMVWLFRDEAELEHVAQYGSLSVASPEDFAELCDEVPTNDTEFESEGADDPLAWTKDFTMTDDEVNELADPEWVFPNLIIAGHVIVIPAEPNAGKTTIMEWVCSQINDAYRVIYINADISGGDAKTAYHKAKRGAYDLLLPDVKAGLSMDDVVRNLASMNRSGGDLSRYVMVFDTLKKMVDVISKRAARALYKELRGLSAKGMTIVLLAHTNKHKGEDGRPIFEGTGDLRADVDEMIYFIPIKNEDGSMTVSTEPDKVRGRFEPITFQISPERKVHMIEYQDTAEERRYAERKREDQPDIDNIEAFLEAGPRNQSEIAKHCRVEHGLSRRRVLTLLARYSRGSRALWSRSNAPENNAAIYFLMRPTENDFEAA